MVSLLNFENLFSKTLNFQTFYQFFFSKSRFSSNFVACTDHSHPHPHVQPGQNIYQTQQQLQGPPQHAHYKQYNPNASYTENLPPPPIITTAAAHPPQTISGNPNYTQQQQIYIQQQQIYAQQQYQTLRRKQAQAQAAVQGQQIAQVQGQQMGQPIYQPQQQQNPQHMQQQQQQMNLPPPQIAQIPPQMQQQQYVVTSANYTPAPPSATMAVVTSNNSIYVQSTTIPTQNMSTMESSIYDRDKQIYKCSTLGRHVGKYNEQRQNLVPAVIPTVPQIPKFNGQPQMTATSTALNSQMTANHSSTLRPSIQNCPLPDIPNNQTSSFKSNNEMIGNDLPQNR